MVEVQHEGDVAFVRLDDGRVNALDTDAMTGLADALEALGREPDLGAVVLSGNERAFSAGVDLTHALDSDADGVEDLLAALSRVVHAVLDQPAPTVAAVAGHALALGCVLAAACDVRLVADTDARIGLPELAVGVPFPTVALEVVRWRMGAGPATAFVLTGRSVALADAVAHGLADEVVAADALAERASEVAGQLAVVPVATMELTRAQLQQPLRDRIAAAPASWDARASATWSAVEVQDAIRAARRG